ncbi:MAG TPA: c-type cytochrome [Burkholderiaceae bacterium]|nr:c-type cytochrome [Burkholderiaceae bacterium]
MLSRCLSGLLLAGFGCSLALANPPPEVWNAPYPEKTAALAAKADATRGASAFEICQGCHRAGALGRPDGSYPRLAGQHATVLIKQLTDVRSDRRSNVKMLPFADHQALSVQDIADIAAYLQALPVPPSQGQGPGGDLARGRQLYDRDCQACHGQMGEGKADRFFPRVSGQHYQYLLRESRMLRDGQRRNVHPEMTAAIAKYTDDELAAVSDYMSRLPVGGR